MRLTRKNIADEKRKIGYLKEEYEAGRMPMSAVLQSYQTWRSYAQKYNSYGVVGNMDRLFAAAMGKHLKREYDGKACFGHPSKNAKEKDYESESEHCTAAV